MVVLLQPYAQTLHSSHVACGPCPLHPGLFKATSGVAEVFGLDVGTHIQDIHKVMGVCPQVRSHSSGATIDHTKTSLFLDAKPLNIPPCVQHDILFPCMTANETLTLFAEIKGLTGSSIAAEVARLLADVGLSDVAGQRVGGFSGGMKRRLSIAIAAIGNPKLLLLDEPTTGTDPGSRRAVWTLIERLKEGRCIILTTHSMIEADTLGTRVGIMADGELAAVGNPLRLKNRYGQGYRLSVVAPKEAVPGVVALVQSITPQARVASTDAGNLIMTVPWGSPPRQALRAAKTAGAGAAAAAGGGGGGGNLIAIIEELELRGVQHGISEWGLSYTTLEEVFLAITGASNFELGRTCQSSLMIDSNKPSAGERPATETESELDDNESMFRGTTSGALAAGIVVDDDFSIESDTSLLAPTQAEIEAGALPSSRLYSSKASRSTRGSDAARQAGLGDVEQGQPAMYASSHGRSAASTRAAMLAGMDRLRGSDATHSTLASLGVAARERSDLSGHRVPSGSTGQQVGLHIVVWQQQQQQHLSCLNMLCHHRVSRSPSPIEPCSART